MFLSIIALLVLPDIATSTEDYSLVTTASYETNLVKNEACEADYQNIKFYLFTRKNTDAHQELKINDTSLLWKSNFNFKQEIKVIIHGWISNNDTILAINSLKDAYAKTTGFNVIIVDWSKLAKDTYKVAKTYADAVVWMITEFIKFLIANGISPTKMHLIGHSIGAHIAGNVGQNVKEMNRVVDAITGLDPALPLYKFSLENQRLDSSDARYVEVIHSSTNSWGYRVPLGHVDFYPNGGRIQPGCDDQREQGDSTIY
ncbi:lipase member H-like [Pectinophora gossypiella]|uniref:lipase member H-like n=1 Tax=Pectinophora gossypiella TaxID=13191 RepID=UPI00214E356C|nr:lipase member H-like [Pectinophora gossypiella]